MATNPLLSLPECELRVSCATRPTVHTKKGVKWIHCRDQNAWATGTVRLNKNDSHGIKTSDPVMFNSPTQLLGIIESIIEKLFVREGITLHLSSKLRRYFSKE